LPGARMLALAGAVAGSAVWFTIVQKWIIGAVCPYCMTIHITGLLLAALVIWRAPKPFDGDSSNVALIKPARATLIGLMLAGILAACQIGFTRAPCIARARRNTMNCPPLIPILCR